MHDQYDFTVLGGGSAGYAAASVAAKAGLRVAVVEGGREVGGLCILRGCMPSKALLATANRAAAVRSAGEFGVKARFEGIDGAAMQARKRLLIKDFADYRREQLESGRFDFLRGMAQFKDAHTVEVVTATGVKTLHSKTFLIATGSTMTPPPVSGLVETGYLDSDALLESESIPGSVIVLGGGAIALEAATFYSQLGSHVTLLQRSERLLKDADPDVSLALAQGLRHHGVRVETGVQLLHCHKEMHAKVVRFRQNGVEAECAAQEIVCALGRVPATHGLALENGGVTTDQLHGRCISVQSTQQTSQPHIFAAGDVCGPLEVVHLAIQQGEIAARNAVRLLSNTAESLEEMDYRLKLLAVFSEPGVAMVGLTEAEAVAKEIPILTASHPFADHGKSMVEGHLQGFVKLIVHAETREILGGSVVGPHAAELIHEVVTAMAFRATAGDLARVPHYHPTLSEIWTYPAEELDSANQHR